MSSKLCQTTCDKQGELVAKPSQLLKLGLHCLGRAYHAIRMSYANRFIFFGSQARHKQKIQVCANQLTSRLLGGKRYFSFLASSTPFLNRNSKHPANVFVARTKSGKVQNPAARSTKHTLSDGLLWKSRVCPPPR